MLFLTQGQLTIIFANQNVTAGNTKGGSITVPLTSCLIGLDQPVLQLKTKIVGYHTADSKPVKQEVNITVILPPLVFLGYIIEASSVKPIFICSHSTLFSQKQFVRQTIGLYSIKILVYEIHRAIRQMFVGQMVFDQNSQSRNCVKNYTYDNQVHQV